MAKKIETMKKELVGEVFSMIELENYMEQYSFIPVETEEDDSEIIKFTNHKSQIWVYGELDNYNCILVVNVSSVSRVFNEQTRVKPFKSYEDLVAVLDYFKSKEQYEQWLIGWMMTSLGRRVGDIVSMKWSDLYNKNGEYKERLNTLKEEKTGKIVGVRVNALAKHYIDEYCKLTGINPMEHYREKIFDITSGWFRKCVKTAIEKVGIKYEISTHSFRKYYASTIYKMHPQDLDRLTVVQSMLGHTDPEKTKLYIDEIDEKIDQYNEDFADYMLKKKDGIAVEISNSPVISFKVETFRKILSLLFDLAKSGKEKFDAINEVLGFAESMRI